MVSLLNKTGNLMLIGPPMVGKTIFVRNVMLEELKKGNGGIYVAANNTGEEIVEWFGEMYNLKVIDCVSKMLYPDIEDTEIIKRIPSPMDFTGITVKVSVFLKENFKNHIKSFVVFDSLSMFLMYLNLQAVIRFLKIMTKRIKLTNSLAIYIVHEGVHDKRVISTLRNEFDGIIEMKEIDNKKFLRLETVKC